MTYFRNHSLRLLSVALLLLGLAPGLTPVKGNNASAEAVSQWLYGFAGEHKSEQAWEKISHLNDKQDEPDLLLRKASKMISANAELFSLPVNNPEPTDEEVFNLLVQEWNRHQQTGSMGATILAERHHKTLPFENVKFSDVVISEYRPDGIDTQVYGFKAITFDAHRLYPLVSGISINAP